MSRTGATNREINPLVLQYVCIESQIPQNYRGLGMSDLPGSARQPVRTFLDTVKDRYVTSKRPLSEYPTDRRYMGRGVLFSGVEGSGKTLAACILQQEAFQLSPTLKSIFLPTSSLLAYRSTKMGLAKALEPDQQEAWSESVSVLEQIKTIPILVLDNLGSEPATDFSRSEIENLLRERHSMARPTIITTRLSSDDLEEHYKKLMLFLDRATDWWSM